MASRRTTLLVGGSMVAVGLAQASIYVGRNEPLPTGLGIAFAALGLAYLRVELDGGDA